MAERPTIVKRRTKKDLKKDCFIKSKIKKGRNCSLPFCLFRCLQVAITKEKHENSLYKDVNLYRLLSWFNNGGYNETRTRTRSPSYIKKSYMSRNARVNSFRINSLCGTSGLSLNAIPFVGVLFHSSQSMSYAISF